MHMPDDLSVTDYMKMIVAANNQDVIDIEPGMVMVFTNVTIQSEQRQHNGFDHRNMSHAPVEHGEDGSTEILHMQWLSYMPTTNLCMLLCRAADTSRGNKFATGPGCIVARVTDRNFTTLRKTLPAVFPQSNEEEAGAVAKAADAPGKPTVKHGRRN